LRELIRLTEIGTILCGKAAIKEAKLHWIAGLLCQEHLRRAQKGDQYHFADLH
jgi:hypothetical protein